MAININDKYYTPNWLVKHTIDKVIELIGIENISEILEPSAGDGAFIEELKKSFPNIKHTYLDLYPEHPEIIEQDYKTAKISYKPGRLTIGNPPFGHTSSLARYFLNKSSRNSDYIAFILPASMYNNTYRFEQGTLIYSELLNGVEYYGVKNVKVNTCLNIYKIEDRDIEIDWRDDELDKIIKIEIDNINSDYYISRFHNLGLYITDIQKYKYFYSIRLIDTSKKEKIEKSLKNIKNIILNDNTLKRYRNPKRPEIKLSLSQYQFRKYLKDLLWPDVNTLVDYGRVFRDGDGYNKNYDYYLANNTNGIKNWGTLVNKKDFYFTFGVKVINEEYRETILNVLNQFNSYFQEIKILKSGPPVIDNQFFYRKLNEFLYSNYKYIIKPIKIERDIYQNPLF